MNIIHHLVGNYKRYLIRNKRTMNGEKINFNQIVLEYWKAKPNIGDVLSKVVYTWMLEKEDLDPLYNPGKIIHLSTIGSVIGYGQYDAVIWGSGVLGIENIQKIVKQSAYRKYDVRAVRGPISGEILKSCGYQTDNTYGDPAVLMPMIYEPYIKEKKYEISVVLHYLQKGKENLYINSNLHYINVMTTDYKNFINEVVQSNLVISSSLHGIIIAESYGVPAIFLKEGMDRV